MLCKDVGGGDPHLRRAKPAGTSGDTLKRMKEKLPKRKREQLCE